MRRYWRMFIALWPVTMTVAILLSIVFVVVWAFNQPKIFPEFKSITHTKTPVGEKETQAKSMRTDKLARTIAGANIIKNAMRNPDSFKLESALIMDTGSVCYKFRSQNGFGGMNKISAVLYGDDIKTSEMEGFARRWNKECANKTGEDVTDYLEIALK